jgi:hypothetical protein
MTQKLAHFKYRFTKLFHSHQAFVVTTIVLCVLLLVFARINVLNEMPEDQVYLDSKISTIKKVNFNEDAIKQIETLKDSDVTTPGTDLPINRQNPFNE